MKNPMKRGDIAVLSIVLLVSVLLTGCMGKAIEKASVALGPGQPVAAPPSFPPEMQKQMETMKEAMQNAPMPDAAGKAVTSDADAGTSNLAERLEEVYSTLHQPGSGAQIRKSFPDTQLVYTDEAKGDSRAPPFILPFRYYYSAEADTTFTICNIDITVFICKGKLDKRVTADDVRDRDCKVAQEYLPMLSMRGGMPPPGMMPDGMGGGMPPGMAGGMQGRMPPMPGGMGGMPGQMPSPEMMQEMMKYYQQQQK